MKKGEILKIILLAFVFLFSVSLVQAQGSLLTETNHVSSSTLSIGYIDTTKENMVKVCKDITCTNPEPGIIDFTEFKESPLKIDKEKGLSGTIWGDELGWITFDSPEGGVIFADKEAGILKGVAKAESGLINFSVTGQKVIIDPETGEWNGWAWATGKNGGWVKFNCKEDSCVHTVWQKEEENIKTENPISPSSVIEIESRNNEHLDIFSIELEDVYNGIKEVAYHDKSLVCNVSNALASSSIDIADKTGHLFTNFFGLVSNFSKNLAGFVLGAEF